jgi:phosphohistidine phosphatase
MPTLLVLRHAKAVTGLGLADIDRPLADRGKRDAAATGERLRGAGFQPGLVLCSPARRTRQTLQGLAFPQVPAEFPPEIYDNEVDVLFDLVRQTDDGVATLLLIGHNPSLHHLVHDLTGEGEAPDAFPTCALAVIELDAPWAGTFPATGRTTALWTPKDPQGLG